MKKIWSVILAAAMMTSSASLVFADEIGNESEMTDIVAEEMTISDNAEDNAVDLFALTDAFSFEYDYSASTDLVRVVKVKYDKGYFTSGINAFKAQIKIPSQYAASVSYSSRLSGFDIKDGYSGGIYTIEGTNGTNRIPSDGALFTMQITLKENILNPFTIELTGDSYLSDASGITQSYADGQINDANLDIPANINDVGESGVDGAVTWEYANEVLKLHGNGTMKDYEQGGAPWYKYADKIKSIEFTEDNLQNIGRNAFYGLNNAQSVILSADISAINNNAFEGCTSLKNINIPTNSGVGIGDYAFKGCSNLTNLYVPSGVRSIGRGAFEGCTKLSSVTLPFIGSQSGDSNTKNTFSYIFNDNVPSSLITVSITDEVAVPESAFEGCRYIENIYLNPSVKTIGAKAFKDCQRLKGFNIPDSVTEISDYTFQNCSEITSINVTDNIKSIGTGTFSGCAKLASIYVPQVTAIENNTFYGCASLKEITIPNSVTNIGENVLTGCTKLIDIRVPFVGANNNPGATAVTDNGVFGYFFGGANSRVPAAVTKVEITSTDRGNYIPVEAFKGCANIEDIIIDGGRTICINAFENCYNLKHLYLPKSVSTIGNASGNRIMSGCTRLETLVVPFVGKSRLDKNTETSVVGSFFGYDDTDPASGTMQYYDNNGGFHYYKVPKTLKNVTILNQTDIPVGAFMECDFIENVSIISGAVMNDYAFYHCYNLKMVALPSDMTSIGTEAFAECESLETINIPTKVKTIGSNAFYGATGIKNITMPDSVTEIASDAFNGTGLYALSEVSLMASNAAFTCSEGSAAHLFAVEKGIPVNLVDSSELDVKTVGANISKLSTNEWLVDVAADGEQFSGTVYAALYDASGKMLAVKAQKTASTESEYRLTFAEAETQGAVSAKVFVWGGTNGMTPITTNPVTPDLPI